MKYINYDFLHENLILRRIPENSAEAYNKLLCLIENRERRAPETMQRFLELPPSKRYRRIVRMFWIYKKMEAIS